MTAAIDVTLTRKRYASASKDALAELHFRVEPGSFTAIVGPSGAGKTTLLKIIAGLDRDYTGTVGMAADARIGFVFQEPRLLPWLSVQDNLHLVKPDLDDATLAQGLERIGLGAQAKTFPQRLSGGMQRRVALLRAFIVRPQVLLLDEPFVSLDAPTAESLRQLLVDLRRDIQPTTLLVTHDVREALALADRILFISKAPATVVLDHPVGLPAVRRRDDATVAAAESALLSRHPSLLAGVHTSVGVAA